MGGDDTWTAVGSDPTGKPGPVLQGLVDQSAAGRHVSGGPRTQVFVHEASGPGQVRSG